MHSETPINRSNSIGGSGAIAIARMPTNAPAITIVLPRLFTRRRSGS